MHYYQVLIASNRYHSDKPLIFNSNLKFKVKTPVVVPLRDKLVPGIVNKEVKKPGFKTKSIVRTISQNPLPQSIINLCEWLEDYYPAKKSITLGLVLPSVLAAPLPDKISGKPNAKNYSIKDIQLPPLNDEQERVIKQIQTISDGSILLHGDTATGKTRVYIELLRQCVIDNHSALILTPEIGLTPQLASNLKAVYGDSVVVYHSTLTARQRVEIWLSIIGSKQPIIVVGPRSALFLPLKKIGLIIVDESHDSAYKHDQSPYYLTSRVAATLAKLHHSKLILATATPPITDYFFFKSKNLPIIRMKKLAAGQPGTSIELVDLTQKHKLKRSQILSNDLIDGIEKTLFNNEQALVFLNKRGTARITLCKKCAWHAVCRNCDVSLIYHEDSHNLRCHMCAKTEKPFTRCPQCANQDITLKSQGTKSIETELNRLFPKARIARFDTDNPKSQKISSVYNDILNQKFDILVGTQVLTKGLDLPNLSFVGVVSADSNLYLPDYSSEETTFQLITQVLGRVGRGHRKGSVLIQTYDPDNQTLKAVLARDYHQFFKQQLAQRQQFSYPPFSHLMKIGCSHKSASIGKDICQKYVNNLKKQNLPVEIIGPSPAFHKKIKNKYRWQIIIKTKNRKNLINIIKQLPAQFYYDIDPSDLL